MFFSGKSKNNQKMEKKTIFIFLNSAFSSEFTGIPIDTISASVKPHPMITFELNHWMYLLHFIFLCLFAFIIINLWLSRKKNKKLNKKMVYYIHTVYDLQKSIELIIESLSETSKDKNISETNNNKLHVALWSASTIKRTISNLIEQEKAEKFFQFILNPKASKEIKLKEKTEAVSSKAGNEVILKDNDIEDSVFIEKLISILKNNLDNSNFTVDILCGKIGMSRSSLYHKIKDNSGLAPADFIRQYRLDKAKEMLSTRQFTISEVAYKTGFSDVKYFRIIFKKQFNANPRDFIKKKL